jgi:hypothetical protein
MSLAALGMAIVLLALLPVWSIGPTWFGGAAGIVIGGLVYVALAYAVKVDELATIRRTLFRR